ncbi:hypothetical protein [Enterococcus innesii]|nr:hypothetical protein [Enterococcus innesii]
MGILITGKPATINKKRFVAFSFHLTDQIPIASPNQGITVI